MTDFASAREAMVDCQVRPSDVTRFPIIDAMLRVPREKFVPAGMVQVAYLGDHIPLGGGRFVLDPRVFGKMLDALNVGPADLVLDVGCGLGYSAAVLAHMAEAVIALEENPDFASSADTLLAEHGADNAVVESGPLAEGCAQHGPFDVIMIEGSAEQIPDAIAGQLKPGGRIAAIFADKIGGQARLGVNTSSGIVWRRIFDATGPALAGFESSKVFEF